MGSHNRIFNNVQRETLTAIVDTFVASLTVEEEEALIETALVIHNNSFSKAQISEYARLSASSGNVIERIENKLPRALGSARIKALASVLTLLSYRPTSMLLTGKWTLFKDLSRSDRESILLGWKHSSISALSRQLYNGFMGLALLEVYLAKDQPIYKSLCYPGIEGGHAFFQQQPDYKKIHHERLSMMSTEEAVSSEKFDAIIVGSGAGGGVVAAQLAKAGLSVLVIEKGRYFSQDDMMVDDDGFAFANMFESGGTITNSSGTILTLSASTFGGGTTINYLASIGPQEFVKKQWEKRGLPYFVSQQFEKDLNTVCERIGVSTENITQNGPNQKLIDGCTKLGFEVATMPQNTSGRPHHCGKCYTGCYAGIKNSTTNTWLKDAASHGAKFLDSTRVTRIVTKHGKAVGVACKLDSQENEHCFYANTVVVSAGALHTPSLLLKSGLKNRNIGKDLRLHLSSILTGFYKQAINQAEGSLLTAVCTEFDEKEGSTFGFKVECISNGLGMFAGAISWDGAASHKQHMLKHCNAVTTFAMSRDMDSNCSVKYDKDDQIDISLQLSKHDANKLIEGVIQMAKIHVAAGARELHITQHAAVKSFQFDSTEESSIDNPRFVQWLNLIRKQRPPIPSSGHQMASCRMGSSPSNSATKSTGETWEVRNLYVADASLFPTALGINPMVTIQAIALSVSRHILSTYSPSKL